MAVSSTSIGREMRGPIPDKPRNRPKVPDVVPLVREIYRYSCTGCCLHIVTDDGNLDDGHIEPCIETAIERGHATCQRAAEMLFAMTKTQRREVNKQWRR